LRTSLYVNRSRERFCGPRSAFFEIVRNAGNPVAENAHAPTASCRGSERRSSSGRSRRCSVSRAVGAYCRQLAANVDESDPESVERFRKAVAPIDAYRSRASATGEEEEEPVTPEEPEALETPRES
jgi:hypothetical protein